LFLTWNCSDCVEVKAKTDSKFFFEDEAFGKDGQVLVAIQTFSNVAVREVLSQYALGDDVFVPAIKTHNDVVITDKEEIIKYIKEQGFSTQNDS